MLILDWLIFVPRYSLVNLLLMPLASFKFSHSQICFIRGLIKSLSSKMTDSKIIC